MPGCPAEGMKGTGVEAFVRHAVGLAGVESQLTLVSHDLAHSFRQLSDRRRLARTEIQRLRAVVARHRKESGISQVVDVDEFASRRARSPDVDARRACNRGF